MSALRDLQLEFVDALSSGHFAAVAGHIRVRGSTPARRLAIYRRNSVAKRSAALRASYPVIDKLVGAAFFDHAANAYIAGHPSLSGDLNDYGDGFAAFLSGFPPAAHLPYLADVARLERAWERAYYATDHASLELPRLAEIPAERYGDLRLQLHPAVTLIQSNFPLHAIWQVHQADYEGDGLVNLHASGAALLVTRRGTRTVIQPLERAELIFLALLHESQPFIVALTAALEVDEDFPLQERLTRRVVEGDIVGFSLGDFSLGASPLDDVRP